MAEPFSFLQSESAGSITIKQSVWLQSFANNSGYGIILTDEELKVIFINPKFCELFEIKELSQTFSDKNIIEVFSSANKTLYNTADLSYKSHEAAEKKISQKQEFKLSNGKNIQVIYQPLLLENNLIGHVWVYSDETEIAQSIKKANEDKIFLETILNNVPSGISVFAPSGQYLFVSEKEEANNELRRWMIGKNASQYFSHKNRDGTEVEKRNYYFKKTLEEKAITEWEESFTDDEGNRNDIAKNFIPVTDEKGDIKIIISSQKNISAQKQAETKLEQSEKKFRELFTYTKSIICTHDMSGVILTANPALCDLLEYKAEEVIGKNIKDFLPEGEAEKFQSVYLEQIHREGKSDGLMKVVRRSGETAYLLYQNYVMDEGKHPYVVGFAQNITQRILAEKKLKEAKKETEEMMRSKEKFLAEMSHEIRTPMNGIIGISSLLQKTLLSGEQKFYLNIIEESAQKLLGTINQIQDVSDSGISIKPVKSVAAIEQNKQQSAPVLENDFSNQQINEMARTQANPSEKSSLNKVNTLGSLHVLLAEDNDINQVLAKNILTHWGFENKTVADGEKVLQALENEDFDIILMDIQMPHKNGIEVTREIRKMQNKTKRNIPIIALTAFSIRGEEKKYYEAGMDACLTKPFKEQELYDAISSVLESRKLNPETYAAPVLEQSSLIEEITEKNEEIREEFSNDKLYDLSYLRGIQGSSTDLVNKLIEIFIRTVPPATKEMTYAARNGDWDNVSKLAHKVKSSINTMGIHALKNDIKFVEEMSSKKEELEEVISNITKIDSFVSIAAKQLQEELNLHFAVVS